MNSLRNILIDNIDHEEIIQKLEVLTKDDNLTDDDNSDGQMGDEKSDEVKDVEEEIINNEFKLGDVVDPSVGDFDVDVNDDDDDDDGVDGFDDDTSCLVPLVWPEPGTEVEDLGTGYNYGKRWTYCYGR